MPVKSKQERKISFSLVFTLILLLLMGFGWLVKNKTFLRLRTLRLGNRGLVKPVGEEGIEKQFENQIKDFAFREGLVLLTQSVVEKRTAIATFSGGLTCFFNLEKEVHLQFASLQFILWRAKIEGKNLKTIDLRFDKPVVRY